MISRIPVDQEDLRILDALQDDLPLDHNPWETVGSRIGIPGDEVLFRLNLMAERGVLRGIAPTLESSGLKTGVSTLVALQVPEENIADVAATVNRYREVSHNFRRKGEYNLWFTLAAGSPDRIDEIIDEILALTHPIAMLNLTTIRRYKIDLRFPLLKKPERGPDGSC